MQKITPDIREEEKAMRESLRYWPKRSLLRLEKKLSTDEVVMSEDFNFSYVKQDRPAAVACLVGVSFTKQEWETLLNRLNKKFGEDLEHRVELAAYDFPDWLKKFGTYLYGEAPDYHNGYRLSGQGVDRLVKMVTREIERREQAA